MFKIIILFLTFYFVSNCVSQSNNPSIEISNQIPPADTYRVLLEASTPNLPLDLNGVAYFCHNSGIWFFYQESYNYEANGWIQVSPQCAPTDDDPYDEWYPSPIYSVGLLESSRDTNASTINLFQEEWWGGLNSISSFTESRSNFTGVVKSIVVTGAQPVTFYKDVNYQGESICLQKSNESDLGSFVGWTEFFWGFEPNDIKSFRFGCFSSRKIVSSDASHDLYLRNHHKKQ